MKKNRLTLRAVSSVGERFLDTEEVTCSIHVPPTILLCHRESTKLRRRAVVNDAAIDVDR